MYAIVQIGRVVVLGFSVVGAAFAGKKGYDKASKSRMNADDTKKYYDKKREDLNKEEVERLKKIRASEKKSEEIKAKAEEAVKKKAHSKEVKKQIKELKEVLGTIKTTRKEKADNTLDQERFEETEKKVEELEKSLKS